MDAIAAMATAAIQDGQSKPKLVRQNAVMATTSTSQAPTTIDAKSTTPPSKTKVTHRNAVLLAAPIKKFLKRKQPDSVSEPATAFKWPKSASEAGVPEPYVKHNDLPVYKIAYGRFVHVEMVSEALVFRFSEWDHQVGVGWTMHKIRDISLTPEQFLLLCSMVLNGQADPVEITVSSKFFHVTSQYPCLLTVLLVSTGF